MCSEEKKSLNEPSMDHLLRLESLQNTVANLVMEVRELQEKVEQLEDAGGLQQERGDQERFEIYGA